MASRAVPSLLGRIAGLRSDASESSDLDWLLPVAGITTIEIGLWFLAWHAGLASAPSLRLYGTIGYVVMAAAGLGIFLYQLFRMARRGEPRPLACCIEMLRRNAGRILIIIIAVQLSALGGAAFSSLKTTLPVIVPYWLDPHLADAEQHLLGIAAWQVSQQLFGWATPAIDFVYASWLTVQIVAFYALLLLRPSAAKTRALVTHSVAWLLLGIAGAYLLSSAGPIFYDRIYGGHAFAGLAETLNHAPVAVRTSDMLWRAYALHTNEIASGISAMPSMHVAMAFWLALILQKSRIAPVAWIYFALIVLGSVHLGWHYVSDAVVGTAGMYLIWRAVRPKARPIDVHRAVLERDVG